MFFLQTTPDTTSFLVLGFIVFGVLGIGFVVSLVIRFRDLRRDVELIEQLEEEESKTTAKSP